MTDRYPLLTVENVYYWYWECDPPLSQLDIANEVGCSPGTVSLFMIKNNIPRRDYSKAQYARYENEDKYDQFKDLMSSKEVRDKISDGFKSVWEDPEKRKKLEKANRDRVEDIIGDTQFRILGVLIKKDGLSLSELVKNDRLADYSKKKCDLALRRLVERRFLYRKKRKVGPPSSKIKVYIYFITDAGRVIFDKNNNEIRKKEMKKWAELNREITSKQAKPKLGTTQLKIIGRVKKNGPMFFSEITEKLKEKEISNSSIQHSLKLLYERSVLNRRKVYNEKAKGNNKFEFLYSLNSLNPSDSKKMIDKNKSYYGLGINQEKVLKLLHLSPGMFSSDIFNHPQIKGISSKSLDNTLLKLTRKNLIKRQKKVKRNCRSNNNLKYYYEITSNGKNIIEKNSSINLSDLIL